MSINLSVVYTNTKVLMVLNIKVTLILAGQKTEKTQILSIQQEQKISKEVWMFILVERVKLKKKLDWMKIYASGLIQNIQKVVGKELIVKAKPLVLVQENQVNQNLNVCQTKNVHHYLRKNGHRLLRLNANMIQIPKEKVSQLMFLILEKER